MWTEDVVFNKDESLWAKFLYWDTQVDNLEKGNSVSATLCGCQSSIKIRWSENDGISGESWKDATDDWKWYYAVQRRHEMGYFNSLVKFAVEW